MSDVREFGGGTFEEGPPLLPALWKAKWRIIAGAVVAGLLGFALSALQPITYTAESSVLLSDPRNAGVFRDSGTTFLDPSRYVRNQAELASSTPVLQRTAELIGGRLTVEDLTDLVRVRPSVDLDLLNITATDDTGAGAAQIANAVGNAYQDVVREQVQANADRSLTELQAQRNDLQATIQALEARLATNPGDAGTAAERDAAVQQLIQVTSTADQITVDTSLFGAGVQLFQEATIPRAPTTPQPMRNAALAFVLGALAVSGLAWWRADETAVADNRNDPGPVLRAPLLGQVPDFSAVGIKTPLPTVSAPGSSASEAYHFLVGAIEHELEEGTNRGRSIVVTSAMPTDGKTITSVNLAVAARQDGREVLLIDADTRAGGMTRMLGIPADHGLWELADPEQDLAEVIQLTTIDDDTMLPVIAAKQLDEDTAAFFRTKHFRAAIRRVADHTDLLIIDSPPLLLASDASAIAGHVDGLILVVQRGTPLVLLAEVRERLDLIGTPLLGYVFTKSRPDNTRYGYYGYYGSQRAYGGYGERPAEEESSKGGRRGRRRRGGSSEPAADDAVVQAEPVEAGKGAAE